MARFLEPSESEPLERISAQSSDDAGESGSAPFDDSTNHHSSFGDERTRLERKINKIRDKITFNTISREGDVEEYLRITNGVDNVADNPQLARIRQHFEKKNKKYSQEAEQLQKKLDELERRLEELDNGADPAKIHHRMLHNVGHNIKRTGVNLKEMTGTVINAPLDIAQKVKRNVFGSADNLPAAVNDVGSSSVGQSIFYEEKPTVSTAPATSKQDESDSAAANVSITQSNAESDSLQKLSIQFDGPIEKPELTQRVLKELEVLKSQNITIKNQYDNLKRETDKEIKTLRMDLVESGYKITKLEQSLNETMDLHQNEVKQLKSDLNLIGTRMDYQYNDRFKKIEESIESAQNRMYRMETNWHENSEKLLSAGQNMWNAVMLSFANIVVEVLKIILYFIAVILDSVKPFTGTRKRAGFVVFGAVVLFVLWSALGVSSRLGLLFSPNPNLRPHHAPTLTSSPPP